MICSMQGVMLSELPCCTVYRWKLATYHRHDMYVCVCVCVVLCVCGCSKRRKGKADGAQYVVQSTVYCLVCWSRKREW